MEACAQLRSREPGGGALLQRLRRAAGRGRRAAAGGGAQARHRAVRRPGRLHRPLGAAGPRGRARDALAVLRAAARRARAPRRHGREVHRRRGDGRLRRAGRARGRPGARGARGAGDPRLGARSSPSCRCASPSPPARRSSRSAPGPARARAWRPATWSTRRRGCRPPRPSTASSWASAPIGPRSGAIDYRAGRAGAGEGQGGADPGVGGGRGPLAVRRRRRPDRAPSTWGASASWRCCGTPSRGRRRSAACSSRPSWACPASARAGSCTSWRRSSTRRRSWSSGARAARCPTARASPTGRSGRWSRRRRGSSRATRPRWSRPSCARRWPPSSASRREAGRVEAHLRPLVGLAGAGETGGEHGAWRRFFEALAEQGPVVLVFEDLHWADDGMLDFVDHLVDWATGVPLLVVCTARPELLERRPGLGRRQAQRAHRLAVAAVRAPRRRA